MPDTRNTIAPSPCLGNPTHAPSEPVGTVTVGSGVGTPDGEFLGYRIRILEPVEVSSRMEVHSYPDRASAIDTVNQIAGKLTIRGFTSYRINILDPNDHVVWTLKKAKESRHGG